jgi:hypothetical protein
MKKYVEIPNRDKSTEAENTWFFKCESNKTPFITLKRRTKFADVDWDYITYPKEVHYILDELGTQLRDEAIEIFHKYRNKKSKYRANGVLVSYRNLELSNARLAAEELYDLIVSQIGTN